MVKGPYPKTVNPLDPRRQFCQYWPRECNLTADFRFCWILAPSNQPIREVEPLSTNQLLDPMDLCTLKSANHRAGTTFNQSAFGSTGSWHPQISQSQNWDHYQPIRLRICLWKQTQPLILLNLPPRGSKGLTVFGQNISTEWMKIALHCSA